MHCKHVYEYVSTIDGNCSLCGQPAHQIDWEIMAKEREAHREKYGWFHNTGTWWSI